MNLVLAPLSILAGVLTILAPCTLPIIPAVLGAGSRNKKSLVIVLFSLGLSMLVFTLLLQYSTWFLAWPKTTMRAISSFLILYFALSLLMPNSNLVIKSRQALSSIGNKLFKASNQHNSSLYKDGLFSDILLGLALGPIFTSCSPIFALVLATVLTTNFYYGLLLISIYIISLMITLYYIARMGLSIINSFNFVSNRVVSIFISILLIIVSVVILFGWDKKIDKILLKSSLVQFINKVEYNLLPN